MKLLCVLDNFLGCARVVAEDLFRASFVVVTGGLGFAVVGVKDRVMRVLTANSYHEDTDQQKNGANAALIPAKESAQPQFQPKCQAHAQRA